MKVKGQHMMDLEIIILSKVSQTKKRQVSHDITYMWNLKYNTNELAKQKQTHKPREQTSGCQGEGCGEGTVREFGIDMCTLLYLK